MTSAKRIVASLRSSGAGAPSADPQFGQKRASAAAGVPQFEQFVVADFAIAG